MVTNRMRVRMRVHPCEWLQLREVVDPELMKRFVRMPNPDQSMLRVVTRDSLLKLGSRLVGFALK